MKNLKLDSARRPFPRFWILPGRIRKTERRIYEHYNNNRAESRIPKAESPGATTTTEQNHCRIISRILAESEPSRILAVRGAVEALRDSGFCSEAVSAILGRAESGRKPNAESTNTTTTQQSRTQNPQTKQNPRAPQQQQSRTSAESWVPGRIRTQQNPGR